MITWCLPIPHVLGLAVEPKLLPFMAVTGFDDIDLVAELAEPALTTVRQPVDALAARVVHVLEARLRGEKRPRASHKLLPELVPRESTGRIAS